MLRYVILGFVMLRYVIRIMYTTYLSLVVFVSFPSSFLSWSIPITKLPMRPT